MPVGQGAGFFHQVGAGFDAIDVSAPQRLEVQVVQYEAQVGLAGPMVGKQRGMALGTELFQQRLDELEKMRDLLELAA